MVRGQGTGCISTSFKGYNPEACKFVNLSLLTVLKADAYQAQPPRLSSMLLGVSMNSTPKPTAFSALLVLNPWATNSTTYIINLAAEVVLGNDWACGIEWAPQGGRGPHQHQSVHAQHCRLWESYRYLDGVVDAQERGGHWSVLKGDCRFIAPEVKSRVAKQAFRPQDHYLQLWALQS